MAEFPIACNLQGDYGFKVIVVDEDDTIDFGDFVLFASVYGL